MRAYFLRLDTDPSDTASRQITASVEITAGIWSGGWCLFESADGGLEVLGPDDIVFLSQLDRERFEERLMSEYRRWAKSRCVRGKPKRPSRRAQLRPIVHPAPRGVQ